MSQDVPLVFERQKKRYYLLRLIYDLSKAQTNTSILTSVLAKETELSEFEVDELLDYLEAEGLIRALGDERTAVYITHPGVTEVEQSITNPTKPTEHFMMQVIQHFHRAVGAVQNATHSTDNVAQNIGVNTSEVLPLIHQLRESLGTLPTDEHEQALELVESLEEEVQSPSPRIARVKAFLRGLGTFALDTTSNVLAAAIAKSLGLPS